jgi:hypothetical protein
MELNIGSNIYRNANGIVKVQEKEQIVLQIQPEGHRIFLTMDLYDSCRNHIAHLRRNSWGFNDKSRFDVQTSPVSESLFTFPACVKLINKETKEVVFEVSLVEKETVHIPHGKLYSHKGQLLEITPHWWRLPGRPTMFGSVQDARGAAAIIG